jgi:parallel beta-helix repeat protein
MEGKYRSSFVVLLVLLSATYHTLTTLPNNARASTLFVGGSGPGNYTSIQTAVDSANLGDSVYVFSGIYNESIIVNQTLNLIGEDRNDTVIDGGGSGVVVYVEAQGVSIGGFTVRNSGSDMWDAGIEIHRSSNCVLYENNLTDNKFGIYLNSSNRNTINANSAYNNSGYGIYLRYSSRNFLTNNTAFDHFFGGIYLMDSNDNTVAGNIANDTGGAVSLLASERNIITGNSLTDNVYGIHLDMSWEITVTNNTMLRNGIGIWGDEVKDWNTHTIDTSNSVNGRPARYWKDVIGGTVPQDTGQVILANCTDVIVENQNVSDTSVGISLGFSSRILIEKNVASNSRMGMFFQYSSNNVVDSNNLSGLNYFGIRLWGSERNLMVNNSVASEGRNGRGIRIQHGSRNNSFVDSSVSNYMYGITLDRTTDNILANNTVFNNRYGIYASYSESNIFANNTVAENSRGFLLSTDTLNNRIYHNRILNNIIQAEDLRSNIWDAGYPSGGNYWSDYYGTDFYNGPSQNLFGNDGIGDTPYEIDLDSQDRYPLVDFIVPPPPENLTTETASVNNIHLTWKAPDSPDVHHYLIYRSEDQRNFDFSNPIYNTTDSVDPLWTSWVDVGAADASSPRELYYVVRAVSRTGGVSYTSNTAGKWTKTFPSGFSAFSIPLEPFGAYNVSWYAQHIPNLEFIRWADPSGQWVTHYNGMANGTNDGQARMGEGYEVSLKAETAFTFCGKPASSVRYHEGLGDLVEFRASLVAEEIGSDIILSWNFTNGASAYNIYKAEERNGLQFLSHHLVETVTSTQNIWTDIDASSREGESYYMVVPVDSNGRLGSSTYSVGVFTVEFRAGSDTFALPLDTIEVHSLDWYCDSISDVVGMAYMIQELWKYHSKEMPAEVYDVDVVQSEGYQISTDVGQSFFTFIGH